MLDKYKILLYTVARREFLKRGPIHYNQMWLMEKFIQVVEKSFHFESVPDFCSKKEAFF